MTANSTPSSGGSAPCRIDWRPSRWLPAALLALSMLAPVAVLASELPRGAAWLIAAAALVHGLQQAGQAWRCPAHQLVFDAEGRLHVDGVAAADYALQWRGPLAFLAWHDAGGHRHGLAWWPDTLPPPRRRELRLAADRRPAARAGPSMAP